MLGRPTLLSTINNQWRPVQSIGAAQNSGKQTTAKKPGEIVALQFFKFFAGYQVNRKYNNDYSQCGFCNSFINVD